MGRLAELHNKALPFSLRHARAQWQQLERSIGRVVTRQRRIDSLEETIERLTRQRADKMRLLQVVPQV